MKFTPGLLLVFLLLGCAQAGPGPPPVDLEFLAPVVADLHLAESITGEIPISVRDSMKAIYFERVLADHGITEANFNEQLWAVRSEPAWIDSLYSKAGAIIATQMVEAGEGVE